MFLPITAYLACVLATWLLILSMAVVLQRYQCAALREDGQDLKLNRKIRAQANLTEYAPVFIILVGLAEMLEGNNVLIGTSATLFVVGRLGHGYAMSFREKFPLGRRGGMLLTFAAYVIIILSVLWLLLVGA
jgi:uncharacterized membrane protein YecN with MAPEG domain